jgi:hypothetical protein
MKADNLRPIAMIIGIIASLGTMPLLVATLVVLLALCAFPSPAVAQERKAVLPLLGLAHTLVVHKVRLRLAHLAGDAGALSLENLRLSFEDAHDGRADEGRLTIEAIRHQGPRPWFAPLWLRAQLSPKDGGWRLSGALATSRAQLLVHLRGVQQGGGGELRLSSKRIEFGTGGLRPQALSPALGDVLRDVTGEVAISGRLGWGDRSGEEIEILLEGLGLASALGRVAGLSGVVTLEGLVPPRTAPRQRLALALLDVGLPLTNGEFTGAIDNRTLQVDQLGFDWAGGRLETGTSVLDLDPLAGALKLAVRGLQLSELLKQVEMEGLSGEGVIDGALPLEIVGGSEILVRDGRLEARGPGAIRYRPETTPDVIEQQGASVRLVLDALANFHFTGLTATVNGRTDGAMRVGLSLKGANPDLHEGHPVEFNLNLEGELALLFRRGMRSYQLPADIARRLQEFAR